MNIISDQPFCAKKSSSESHLSDGDSIQFNCSVDAFPADNLSFKWFVITEMDKMSNFSKKQVREEFSK